MNGYNWDALIRYYVTTLDPELMDEIESDPEAGMYSGYMSFSPDNVRKMKKFESHVRAMVADENKLMQFIDENYDDIEWD